MFSELGSFSLIFNSSNYFKSWRHNLPLLSLWRGFWHWSTQSEFFHRVVLQHIPFQQNLYTIPGKGKRSMIQAKLWKYRGIPFAAIPAVSLFCSQVQSVHPRLNYSTRMAVTSPLLQAILQIGVSCEAEQSEHPGWSSMPTTAEQGHLGMPCRRSTGPEPTLEPGLARIPATLADSQAELPSTAKVATQPSRPKDQQGATYKPEPSTAGTTHAPHQA